MKKILKKIYLLPLAAAALTMGSCIDEVQPTDVASASQVAADPEAFEKLVNGLQPLMTQTNTYGSGSGSWSEAAGDWGVPCYLLWKEIMCDGTPSTGTSWNYQYYLEEGTNYTTLTRYPYYFYYFFINNTNPILKLASEETASAEVKKSLGVVRAYRAMCYLELSTMFEFFKTGYSDLDAEAADIMGLTVPIVTEATTNEEAKSNPRAPFYKMYRFIYNDLSLAEEDLKNYSRSDKNDINEDVVNGLMARFWLNLATRFNRNSDDLSTQLSHEADDDGFKALGVTSAADCYAKAQAYAQKVINAGYSPVTESQWNSVTDGFNSANQAWVWCIKFTSTEQTPRYWCTLHGIYASEPTWGMSAYGGEYRCISTKLYNEMGEGDWRKASWVAPEDAGADAVPAKYATALKAATTETTKANTAWNRLPAYANLKFRPADGIIDGLEEDGLLVDVPLMRVEEMYFIKMEAALHLQGLGAAKTQLEQFLNTYRYTDGSYTCDATTESGFVKELIAQKYIEFWGEGIVYNDYKRLGLPVERYYDGTNYLDAYLMNSKDGYTAPWMNFYIPDNEATFNTAVVGNPNPTTYIQKYCIIKK